MNISTCFLCERIDEIKNGTNPYIVAELETGYLLVGDFQYFRGYTIFAAKEHKEELHELDAQTRTKFLVEMSQVAEAAFRAFKPEKMNYELLGNKVRHMHWHLFPRYANDPAAEGPIWYIDKSIRSNESARPTTQEIAAIKVALLKELKQMGVIK